MFSLVRPSRQAAVIGSLVFASAVCTALLCARIVVTGTTAYRGMAWNLFLAWLPLLSALAAYHLVRRSARSAWALIAACAFIWLLFFPNAPYILTDIERLRPRSHIPIWYDLMLLIAYGWTGLLLGAVSLYLMQTLVRRAAGAAASWLFAITVLFVSGFGVYLGRFLRWNSWDLFTQPVTVLAHIWEQVSNPIENWRVFAFSGLLALVFISVYIVLVAMVHWHGDQPRAELVRTDD